MIINTGSKVTIRRSNLAKILGKKFIWMLPYITLHTVTGDKINVQRKAHLNITTGDVTYHYMVYV